MIAESTRKLLGNLFQLEDLGSQDLKGISGPVRAGGGTTFFNREPFRRYAHKRLD